MRYSDCNLHKFCFNITIQAASDLDFLSSSSILRATNSTRLNKISKVAFYLFFSWGKKMPVLYFHQNSILSGLFLNLTSFFCLVFFFFFEGVGLFSFCLFFYLFYFVLN